MTILQGKGVSGGIAIGRVAFIEHVNIEKKLITDTAAEVERFHEARRAACEQLETLSAAMEKKLGKENAVLFEIHQMMLEDPDFFEPIIALIETELFCAEFAAHTAGLQLAEDFANMDDEYMRERAIDMKDIVRRVTDILLGVTHDATAGNEPLILAAQDFTPSETAQFDRSKVLALVSKEGAANSHTAIFARTMGIPAIIGLGDSLSAELSGKDAALDGGTGILYIQPDTQILGDLQQKRAKLQAEHEVLERFRGKPTVSKSGRKTKLYANIGSVEDAEAAIAGDAEGIGLFRSEFLFLGRDDYPSENIQFDSYKKVAEKMQGKQVIIRTLDIGADKQAEYFKLPHEENPAMGMRAIRICLTRPELFKTQLRALYRASAFGNIAIMFPMIASLSDLQRAKKIAAEVREELTAANVNFNPKTPLGIMIETPASVIISDILAKEADFFSIGTNDLTQYTLAVDRQNDAISEFCDTHHEAILRMIRMTVENAHKAGIETGICGMLGADPALTQTFLDMGVDELSVEPGYILGLRGRIAEM